MATYFGFSLAAWLKIIFEFAVTTKYSAQREKSAGAA
jgi:hypothetical protein